MDGAGRNRSFVIEEAMEDRRYIVGLDFAFSFLCGFVRSSEFKTAFEVWAQAAKEGAGWLHDCSVPLLGTPRNHVLRTARDFVGQSGTVLPTVRGQSPKSVFQIGGAGAVGTGSIRGMPILQTLREAGFSIWPFDPPGWPTVVEIYPRALTGAVNKSSRDARQTYLRMKFTALSTSVRDRSSLM